MAPSAVSSTPATSWWYGQGHAVDVVRRLETLHAAASPPGTAGVVTVGRGDLTVTFVEGLKAPLPQPWQSAGAQARIDWAAVATASQPDPTHPVYLVVFGTTDDGALVGLNLAAFSRVSIGGDPDTAQALVRRWVLELLATHPTTTIGVSADLWPAPLTSRVLPIAAGQVPDVDVLALGAGLTYAERAQIVAATSSPILLDLGEDPAVATNWTITCGPDRLGRISNNVRPGKPMTATLIIPSAEVVDLCSDLVTNPSPGSQPSQIPVAQPQPTPVEQDSVHELTTPIDVADPVPSLIDTSSGLLSPQPVATDVEPQARAAVDFFAAGPASSALGAELIAAQAALNPLHAFDAHPAATDTATGSTGTDPAGGGQPTLPTTPAHDWPQNQQPALINDPSDCSAPTPAPTRTVKIAVIWSRILGQVELCPPHGTPGRPDREKRLNELAVFLQRHPWVSSGEIIKGVYGGAASDKTVTQQLSLLRKRLGKLHPGGPDALPYIHDGEYHLENIVRSDWMEFERLVEILVETTETANLIAAMELVTGPPFGGIGAKEWQWSKDLREEIRDRVAEAAVVLAGRHRDTQQFSAAVEVARKGLWYDTARQDLWQIALDSALKGHDKDTFRALRSQYLAEIPSSEREPAVFDLTKRAG